jgi:hypothetical protein
MAFMPRATHVLQWSVQRAAKRNRSQSQKADPSSDWSLQLDSMKVESLVIAHQPWRGEYVPGPCTHRPSSHGSRGCLKMVTAQELSKVKLVTGAKS